MYDVNSNVRGDYDTVPSTIMEAEETATISHEDPATDEDTDDDNEDMDDDDR